MASLCIGDGTLCDGMRGDPLAELRVPQEVERIAHGTVVVRR